MRVFYNYYLYPNKDSRLMKILILWQNSRVVLSCVGIIWRKKDQDLRHEEVNFLRYPASRCFVRQIHLLLYYIFVFLHLCICCYLHQNIVSFGLKYVSKTYYSLIFLFSSNIPCTRVRYSLAIRGMYNAWPLLVRVCANVMITSNQCD